MYLAVSARYEKIISHTSFPVLGSLHQGVLGVGLEVGGVCEGEGAGLQLLVELCPTEPVLLLYISIVFTVQR